MITDDRDVLASLRERAAADMVVEKVAGPVEPWAFAHGELVNRAADFFRVIGRMTTEGPRLLLRQPETALVGLVVAGSAGSRQVLVNARAEPGLPGYCQVSTTVQSTPANFERRHSGGRTPHLSEVLGGGAGTRVLYDARHSDWGQYYHRKEKRLRLVEVPEAYHASFPHAWVSLDALDALAGADHSLTIDLRTSLVALRLVDEAAARGDAPSVLDARVTPSLPEATPSRGEHDIPIEHGAHWRVDADGVVARDGSRRIEWVRTSGGSREVAEWVQPLMVIAEPLRLRLAVRRHGDEQEFAVVPRSLCGMDGTWSWYPAPAEGGRVVARVTAAAEGGRFLRHEVFLEVVSDASVGDATWLSRSVAARLVLAPLTTSVELRVLLGLALADGAVG